MAGSNVVAVSRWSAIKARLTVLVGDTALIAMFVLMAEFLVLAFSGRRGETGFLLTAEETLGLLHYGLAGLIGAVGAVAWSMGASSLGGTPSQGLLGEGPERDASMSWQHTLAGWFGALFIQLTFFTGWLITELDVVDFLTKFGKAWDIVRGLINPSGAVLEQGLVLLVQTIFLAFMATAFAIPVAFVLSFPSARNLTRGSAGARLTYTVARTAMNFVRAVEPLVWALIFISWVGIGPFAGVLALWVHSVAALTKLYSEQIESIDPGPMDAIVATGASTLQVLRYGVVPQVIPPFLSFTIYRWDINVRMSTIIGFVGGGGIGYILKPRVDLGAWGEVGTLVLLIAGTVWLMDIISATIREKIV
jgi:phosphonate transport system permease protein